MIKRLGLEDPQSGEGSWDRGQEPESKTLECRKEILAQALSDAAPQQSWAGRRDGFPRRPGTQPRLESGLEQGGSAGIAGSQLSSLPINHAASQRDLSRTLRGTPPKKMLPWALCDWSYRVAKPETVGVTEANSSLQSRRR